MGIVALIGLLVGVGFSLPPHQTIRRTAVYDRPYDEVWKVLADFPGRAAWREEVQRVQALPDRNGNQVWRVLGNDYEQTLEITSYSPGRHLVVAFTDERHTFTGARAFDIRAEGKQTRITLTESGEIESAILRLACRTVFDRGEDLTLYLVELGRVFGQEVEPVDPTEAEKPKIQTLF